MARNFSPVIEFPARYDAARKSYILANANKTFERTYSDFREILDFIAPGRIFQDDQCVGYHEGFLGSLASAFDTYGKLTEGQVNAVRKSIVKKAERKAELAAQRAAERANSTFLGAVGDKLTLTLKVVHIIVLEGFYGNTYINICEDADKNVVIYKGNAKGFPNAGETATVTATVSAHSEREGVKQTVIQRPKLVSVTTA